MTPFTPWTVHRAHCLHQRERSIGRAIMNAVHLHAVHSAKADTPDLPYLM